MEANEIRDQRIQNAKSFGTTGEGSKGEGGVGEGGGGGGETQSDSGILETNQATNVFGILNSNKPSMDSTAMLDSVLGGFSSTIASIGKGIIGGFKINNSKINGDVSTGGKLKQLIDLILKVVKLPVRMIDMSKSIAYAGASLGLGLAGLGQSFALGTKDLYILLFAILKIIFKYWYCIISFWITTLGGCIFIHVISLFFVILHLCIMYIVDTLNEYIGLDFTLMVDDVFEYIKWPDLIQTVCYTCFGKPVKLREVLTDVGVIEDIGNKISYDFNYHMPRYMKPSIPYGTKSLKSLNKAIN